MKKIYHEPVEPIVLHRLELGHDIVIDVKALGQLGVAEMPPVYRRNVLLVIGIVKVLDRPGHVDRNEPAEASWRRHAAALSHKLRRVRIVIGRYPNFQVDGRCGESTTSHYLMFQVS